MKKYILIGLLSFVGSITNLYSEPNGRGYDPHTPAIGLPDGNEVLTGLIIAIIAFPIGYAISNASRKENSSDESMFPGCLGIIFYVGGIIGLLPLIAWVFSILSAVYTIGLILIVIIGIIGFIFSKLK